MPVVELFLRSLLTDRVELGDLLSSRLRSSIWAETLPELSMVDRGNVAALGGSVQVMSGVAVARVLTMGSARWRRGRRPGFSGSVEGDSA